MPFPRDRPIWKGSVGHAVVVVVVEFVAVALKLSLLLDNELGYYKNLKFLV
jgi:hypothetical protein